jgi:uncharacterized protein
MGGTAATLRSLDGTVLAAGVMIPSAATRGVVLVHGGGVDRHEGGFFDRVAATRSAWTRAERGTS